MTVRANTLTRRILFLNRRAPHGSIHALEALEAVLMGAAFEQSIWLVFMDDGVYQLCKGQDTRALGVKNFSLTYRALEMYEVERVVVEGASLDARGLEAEDLLIDAERMDGRELQALMNASDVVLSF